MSSLNQTLNEYQKKIDALSLRERALLFISVLAVAYLLWDALFLGPSMQANKRLQNQLVASQSELQTLNTELITLNTIAGIDPDHARKKQLANLKNQLQRLDGRLSELSQGLIAADQLPRLLEEVLQRTSKLTLVSMRTLPVEELELISRERDAKADKSDRKRPSRLSAKKDEEITTGVFKHTVSLTLRGTYSQTLAYLQALEQLSWRFYWDSLDYRVDRYPNGEVDVKVYTLSAEEGLLGV